MVDCILINGDSYTAPAEQFSVYSEILGQKHNLPVVNIAVQGSNNDRILRSTLEKVLELKSQNKNPLVIVAWSFVRRLEVWYYGNNKTILDKIPDSTDKPQHLLPRFVTLDMLIKENAATIEQKCLIQEDLFVHKQLTDFYTNMYLLANTLTSLNVEWFMFSAARNTDLSPDCFPYINSLQYVQWCLKQKNIYKLHEFCIKDWSLENDPDRKPNTGHLSKQGHIDFSAVLEKWLIDAGHNFRNI